jgi:hypothetical protein
MIRTILVAAAALASVSFSPGHAQGAQASWCAVINQGRGSVYWDCQYYSFEDCYRRGNILAGNIGFCNRVRTTSLDPRSKGGPGNVALMSNKSALLIPAGCQICERKLRIAAAVANGTTAVYGSTLIYCLG